MGSYTTRYLEEHPPAVCVLVSKQARPREPGAIAPQQHREQSVTAVLD